VVLFGVFLGSLAFAQSTFMDDLADCVDSGSNTAKRRCVSDLIVLNPDGDGHDAVQMADLQNCIFRGNPTSCVNTWIVANPAGSGQPDGDLTQVASLLQTLLIAGEILVYLGAVYFGFRFMDYIL